jgi:hypothetical protein
MACMEIHWRLAFFACICQTVVFVWVRLVVLWLRHYSLCQKIASLRSNEVIEFYQFM